MELSFSFIVPVYNRPDEIEELLESMVNLDYPKPFELVLVEDGSTQRSESVVKAYADRLSISYYTKSNSGPGHSRNYGMERAKGNYYIILDSDCILPPPYLDRVQESLKSQFVHCYGGPDKAHDSFSPLQKAIDYAMTSFWTTGGIRGKKGAVDKFQPRSFNMGISKEAFLTVGGFGNIHPGEDPDLSLRLWNQGYKTRLLPEAYVYHKRRIHWKTFFAQVYKFGMVRPILNSWHPGSSKITYWFPALFCIGGIASLVGVFLGIYIPLTLYTLYFLLVFFGALGRYGNLGVALLTIPAVCIQFWGYGYGFLKSSIWITFSRKSPEMLFPDLFFKIPNA
ncbi:MAG: glycosyltransferase [Bacteroidota bacterium]